MSILSYLLGSLSGEDAEVTVSDAEHPCSNCPSGCQLAPQACDVCEPYKKRLLDALYNVDHIDEIRARYEVVTDEGLAVGTVTCPRCLGSSENPYVCDYCGSKIGEGTDTIKVASASDIPNPIMDAQDIIFERHNEVVKAYAQSEETSSGLFDMFSFMFSSEDVEDEFADGLGSKMSEAEIIQMAELYEVPVSTYLAGMDDDKYPTLAEYKVLKQAQQAQQAGYPAGSAIPSPVSGMGAALLGGLAAAAFSGGSLFGGSPSAYGSPLGGSSYGSSYGSGYGTSGSSLQQHQGHVSGSSVSQHHNSGPNAFSQVQHSVSHQTAHAAPQQHNPAFGQPGASSAHSSHASSSHRPQAAAHSAARPQQLSNQISSMLGGSAKPAAASGRKESSLNSGKKPAGGSPNRKPSGNSGKKSSGNSQPRRHS